MFLSLWLCNVTMVHCRAKKSSRAHVLPEQLCLAQVSCSVLYSSSSPFHPHCHPVRHPASVCCCFLLSVFSCPGSPFLIILCCPWSRFMFGCSASSNAPKLGVKEVIFFFLSGYRVSGLNLDFLFFSFLVLWFTFLEHSNNFTQVFYMCVFCFG